MLGSYLDPCLCSPFCVPNIDYEDGRRGVGFGVYLDPKEPTFLGLLIMISLYRSKKKVLWGLSRGQGSLGSKQCYSPAEHLPETL